MAYWMYRERDGRGDSGSMSMALVPTYDENGKVVNIQYINGARPQVGYVMRVGSTYARTMQHQDWWQTTLIKEILEESENYVKFKTHSGSIYEWKKL